MLIRAGHIVGPGSKRLLGLDAEVLLSVILDKGMSTIFEILTLQTSIVVLRPIILYREEIRVDTHLLCVIVQKRYSKGWTTSSRLDQLTISRAASYLHVGMLKSFDDRRIGTMRQYMCVQLGVLKLGRRSCRPRMSSPLPSHWFAILRRAHCREICRNSQDPSVGVKCQSRGRRLGHVKTQHS
jgi:hypothetical protein